MKHINITNGEYLNNYLLNKYEGIFIPFNEALIQGELLYPLFNDEFINKRSLVHHVSKELYKSKLQDLIDIEKEIDHIESIVLWFGKDAFCVINLLGVLTYLEDINYQNKVTINLVDDETFNVIESNIEVKLSSFKEVYCKLINRNLIEIEYNFINEGLKNYLYITSSQSDIMNYIKENINKIDEEELIVNVLNKTSIYGLSDVFIKEMINKVKGSL